MLNARRSWDPLYGRIELTEFEFGLLHLPEVQRLRYVRMCNINSLLVAGASEISRFEHTIGVLWLAKRWTQTHAVPNSNAKEIIAAAVLHDMQTGPFGHSMQYVLEDNDLDSTFIHEDLSHGWRSAYHQEILAGASFAGKAFNAPAYLGTHWENVAKIIRGEGNYGPLIAGTMDLDNIDNVVRLAFHVGVTEKDDHLVALRLAEQLKLENGNIILPDSMTETVVRWQKIRKRLYELLLLDWAEFSAKAMLTRAIEEASGHNLIGSDSWVRTDAEFLEYLDRTAIGDAQEVRNLIRRLKAGDLYEPILLLGSPSIDTYGTLNSIEVKRELEAEIIRESKVKGAKIIIHFILDKGKTERAVSFVNENGESRVIGQSSRQILCGLFVSSSTTESEKKELFNACSQLLKERGIDNQVQLNDPMGNPSPAQQLLI